MAKIAIFLLPTPVAKIELSQLNLLPPKSTVLLVFLGSEKSSPVALPKHASLKFEPVNIKAPNFRHTKFWWVERT